MNWLDKLERKFGRYYIPNLMLYVIIGNLVLFVFSFLFPALGLEGYVSFNRDAILHGQVWRVLTFIFVPLSSSPIWMLVGAYCYWLIGKQLEDVWGGFRFNVFYFSGMIFAIIGGFIAGAAVNMYLNLSMLLAFAIVYPNTQFLLFFVIPIKAKYIGYGYAALLVYWFIVSGTAGRVAIAASVLNIVLFFGGDFYTRIRNRIRFSKQRKAFRTNIGK